MTILDVEQGSEQWQQARAGLPTASRFDEILTPGGDLSKQAGKYLAHLVAEWYMGQPLTDAAETQAMQRGKELEPAARAEYEYDNDLDLTRVGLCLTDDGRVGASPDSLVGDEGLLEVKCPLLVTHMDYLLGGMAGKYHSQVQGQLWVTGRKWCDLYAYSPVLPAVKVRIDRDDEYIKRLAAAVGTFVDKLEAARERLAPEKAAYDAKVAAKLEEAAMVSDHQF